jgi:hypothetical protein
VHHIVRAHKITVNYSSLLQGLPESFNFSLGYDQDLPFPGFAYHERLVSRQGLPEINILMILSKTISSQKRLQDFPDSISYWSGLNRG